MEQRVEFSTKDGYKYYYDIYGIIHQVKPEIIEYTTEYIDTYRSPEYQKASAQLAGIRLGSVLTAYRIQFNRDVDFLLDYGYGDGTFLKAASSHVKTCSGFDITDEKTPIGCERVDEERARTMPFDVVTFWDVFEHIPDIEFIETLNAHMVFMSMPDIKNKNFETWKHRKPNEHIHHFMPYALKLFMSDHGWKMIFVNHQEDVVRKGEKDNIMTAAFVRF